MSKQPFNESTSNGTEGFFSLKVDNNFCLIRLLMMIVGVCAHDSPELQPLNDSHEESVA